MVLSPTKSKKPLTSKQAASSRNTASSSNSFGALKLQKGSKPLTGKAFFFDIKNHSTASKLESTIKSYGGVVNPFLGKDISLVITDKPEWGGAVPTAAAGSPLYAGGTPRPSPSPSPLQHLFSPAASPAGNSRGSNFSPSTLDSPGESTGGGRRAPKSRAEAMLERVRAQPQFRTRDPLVDAQNWGLNIWSVEKILRLFQKIAQGQKKSVNDTPIVPPKRKSETTCSKVRLRTGKFFVKIESADRNYRPSYKDLPCWPTINLDSEPGTSPFVLKPACSAIKALVCKEQSASKQAGAQLQNKGQRPVLRRSPRKRNSPQKQNSPTKRNAATSQSQKKCTNLVFQDKESPPSLVPPRPPSKRHPDRALFPDYEPLAGYCEICKVDFQDLRNHCQTDGHKEYSMNDENYAQLDRRINSQALTAETFINLITPVTTRNSKPEGQVGPALAEVNDAESESVNMRQPVDDRHIPAKMVGRKETLEVQCNGIPNHVQTRFTCTKGDRENLGGIFLDERLTAAQLRKRRSISVSCKDLLEIAPSSERTHYLRSGRPARSELSQLSPALSDNSHPLLNSNSQQPLLSPTLSERGHHLRTRSQIWSNVIEEESLLVTANNHSDKEKTEKSVDKVEKSEKGEGSDKVDQTDKLSPQDGAINGDAEEEKDVKETNDRELRPPRNQSRNRSIRRKRLSAEEKLIEDNRGYYKVEVLNSKLRSTGLFVNQTNQGEGAVNGCASNGPGRSGSQEGKEPVVVRFKKVRRSELSVLSDEAENFMFGEQTRSDTNSDDSSESAEEEEEEEEEGDLEEEDDDVEDDDNDESGGTDANGVSENGTDSSRSRSSQRNGCRSSRRHTRLRLRVGADGTYTRYAGAESGGTNQSNSSESNGFRSCRKRRSQAEAFISDNIDYYKFELSGSRLRVHGSPTSGDVEDSVKQEKSKLPVMEEPIASVVIDGTPCPLEDLHFSFESVPSSEVWFQTFQRQDRGEELDFPSVSEPSSVVLPYQIPKQRDPNRGLQVLGKRRSRNSVRLPRKSPRCHASTLAILSSVVKRRSSKDPGPAPAAAAPTEDAAPDLIPEVEPKNALAKQSQPSTSASADQQATLAARIDRLNGEEEIQEIARSIDSMLGLVPPSSSDLEKDLEVTQPKPTKGRGRKKQAVSKQPAQVIAVPAVNPDPVPESEREKDFTLNYLVDPAILDELACTCDVISDPRGGPTMDILSLLDSYSECCCLEDSAFTDHGIDASCNSSECGASSVCDNDRRMRKKRKRRINQTGWDKPKRKCMLRRDAVGPVSDEQESLKDPSSKDSLEESETLTSQDSESSVHKVPNSISSPPSFQRKCGSKRKLRSSLALTDSSRKGNICGQPRINVMKMEKDGEVSIPSKKGKGRKVRRIGWSKAR
ncbi:uncharacterized protein LOC117646652 [Thrips palmi]|uniref:Uncharacterized protein LOC117646652 n=1 Tax=Thrips palmi TaxID=161013 RepID=A0A6P8YUB0_THRPL|nr:uncharacterized protein LOC117646652 [Thrips palmi]